jgi:hypothetical protein
VEQREDASTAQSSLAVRSHFQVPHKIRARTVATPQSLEDGSPHVERKVHAAEGIGEPLVEYRIPIFKLRNPMELHLRGRVTRDNRWGFYFLGKSATVGKRIDVKASKIGNVARFGRFGLGASLLSKAERLLASSDKERQG